MVNSTAAIRLVLAWGFSPKAAQSMSICRSQTEDRDAGPTVFLGIGDHISSSEWVELASIKSKRQFPP